MFGWTGSDPDVDLLIARKKYGRAVKLLRGYLEEEPDNIRLRQRLADALLLDGQTSEAVQVLYPLVDEFVDTGFMAKAIAILKKIQRIEPGHSIVEERLATLVRQKTESTREIIAAPPEDLASSRTDASESDSAGPKISLPPTDRIPIIRLDQEHGDDGFEGFRRSALFGHFSESELLALIRGFNLQTFEPGEIVVTEGEPGDSLFVIASGTVRVYVSGPTGRSEQVRTLSQGEFFGEISLLSGQARSATITCATPCEFLELDRRTLNEIAARNPEVPKIIDTYYQRRVNSPEELEVRTSIEIPL